MTKIRMFCTALTISSALSILICSSAAFAMPFPMESWQTEKVVMVMRHGVRSGASNAHTSQYSTHTWPDFGVGDHELTPHGWAALRHWGAYHRLRLAHLGLLPPQGLLDDGQLAAFASPTQRTVDSAVAFLQGFAQDCDVRPDVAHTRDWFLPPMNGLAEADPAVVERAVVEGLGMPLTLAETTYRPLMEALEDRFGIPDRRFSSMRWAVQMDQDGAYIPSLRFFNRLVETVRMQYANDLPSEQIGFGGINDQAALAALMLVRGVNYDATQHPRYLAVRHAAPLLERVSGSLLSEGTDANQTVSLYVGHDANLAAVRSVLGFDWQMPEHLPNDAGPGGMLLFERVRHLPSQERYVRISYHAATMDQIRQLQPLDSTTPPFMAMLEPPESFDAFGANLLPIRQFTGLVRTALEETGRAAVSATPSISPSPAVTRRDVDRPGAYRVHRGFADYLREGTHRVAQGSDHDNMVSPFSHR